MGVLDYLGGGVAGGASGVGKGISSMFHPERGYEDAAEEMRKAWEQAQGFQRPYNEAGQSQLPILTGAQSKLMDPSALLGEWMEKYKTSPYAQRSMENAKESGLGAASSMGLMGSSSALNNIQQSSSDIMNADRQQFLNDLMQKYMTGIGIGQNIYGIGATTAGNLGKQAMNYGGNAAEMAFGRRNAPGQNIKDLIGMGGKMAASYFGGGS
jgi:hypothetical protein